MILGIVSVMVGFLAAAVFNVVEDRRRRNNSISFRQSYERGKMPVVKVKCGNHEVYLMVDTGSDDSYMSPSAMRILEECICEKSKLSHTLVGGTGSSVSETTEVTLPIVYNKKSFMEPFVIVDSLDSQFSQIERTRGITIYGILGSRFLREHECLIDFNRLEVCVNGKGNNIKRKRNRKQACTD